MSAENFYPESRIKRHRATKCDMSDRRRRLIQIVGADHPTTCRQTYHQAEKGIIPCGKSGGNWIASKRRLRAFYDCVDRRAGAP